MPHCGLGRHTGTTTRSASSSTGTRARSTATCSEAEDLTSAVFLQAWRRRADVAIDRDSSLPWLLGVARRLAQNSSRARRRYQAALARIGTHLAEDTPP